MKKNEDQAKDIFFSAKLFACGGLAGCCAKTTVAPLDRVKILLQAHSRSFETQGVTRTLLGVWHSEGLYGFYRGNGAQMLRIFPYSAIQFFAYDSYSALLTEKFGESKAAQLASGSMAGVTALLSTYPLDVVRARLSFQRKGSIAYAGIVDCLKKMAKEGKGLRAFYVGFLPSVCGMIPYAGISFYVFNSLKLAGLQHCPDWLAVTESDGSQRLRAGAHLVFGGFAGALAQTVSYPLDSTRRTMQVAVMRNEAGANGSTASMGRTLASLYRQYGIARGLYRGLTINYVRVVPMAAVSFSTYEALRRLMGVN